MKISNENNYSKALGSQVSATVDIKGSSHFPAVHKLKFVYIKAVAPGGNSLGISENTVKSQDLCKLNLIERYADVKIQII